MNEEAKGEIPPLKTKKGKKLAVIAGVVAVLLILTGAGVYFLLPKSPQAIFRTVTDRLYKQVSDVLVDVDNTKEEEKLYLDFNISTSDKNINEQLKEVNKFGLSIEGSTDTKNKLFKGNMRLKYDKDDLFTVDLYVDNTDLYVKSEQLYSNYLLLPLKDFYQDLENDLDSETIKIAVDSVYKAFVDSLTKDDFTGGKETITVDNKKVEVNKTLLIINDKNAKRITENIVKSLKNDKEFLKAVTKLAEISEEEIKKSLDELLEEDFSDMEGLYFAVYTKGVLNDFVRFEFGPEQAITNKEEILSITKINDKNYEFSFMSKEEGIAIDGSFENKETKNGKTLTQNIELTLKIKTDEVTIEGTVRIKDEITPIDTFEKVDVSKAKKLEEMTEEDMNEIMDNISKNEFLSGIIQEFLGGIN